MFAVPSRLVLRRVILATSIAGLLAAGASAADVFLRGNDPLNTTAFNAAGTGPNGWNDDLAPSEGNNYFTSGFQLRTPTGAAAAVFAGDSLSIDGGGSLLFKGSGVYTINNLILNGGSIIQGDVSVASPGNIGTLAGTITVAAPSSFDTTPNTNRIITVNSVIHGSAGLTILGSMGIAGAVNFTNTSNDFTGSLTFTGSSPLAIPALANGGIASAMGAASADAANLIFNGGRLRVNGATASSTDRLFTLNTTGGVIDSGHATAAVSFTNSGAIALADSGARTLTFGGVSTGANTFAPIIGDNGGPTSVTKIEAGSWELTAANTYTGATNINGGTLSFSNINNFGTGTALNIGSGNTTSTASLRWSTGNTTDITTVRTVTLTGGNGGLNTNGQNITLAGAIGGSGNLVKQGNGVLTLTGSNTFSGGVSVGNSSGAIRVTNSQALGIGTKTISVVGNQGNANSPSLILAGGANPIVLPASFSFITSNDGLNNNPTAPALVNESGDNTINGNFTLRDGGGGTRYLVNGGSLTLNGTVAPISGQTRTALFSGAGNGLANGVLQNFSSTNTLSVTKDGGGTWVLNGANTYTGATNVNAGTLITNTGSTGGGAVTVTSGSTFGVRVAGPGQTFTTSNLTLNAGTTGLVLDLGPFGTPTAPVIATPTFNPNAAVTVTVLGTALSTGSAIPLVDYGTLGGGGLAGMSLVLPPRATGSLVENTVDGRVDLALTSFDYPRWSGATDGNWNTTTQNWREVNSGNATAYIQGAGGSDSVLFDDNATGTTTVNLTATLTPSSVYVFNPTKDYIFSGSGKLSGATGLLKQGTGKLTIANTGGNDYSGPTTIIGSTVQIGDGVTPGAGQLGTGPVVNNGTLVFHRPDDFSVSNVISGTGNVTKNGTNVLTLLSNNTFSGTLSVAAGTLRLGSANALGTTAGGTTVQSGATLEVNGFLVPVAETVTISGAGVGGNGAVINSALGGTNAGLKNLILAGNASIGGTERWDIRDSVGGVAGNGFALTKVGTNNIWFKDLAETQLGSIAINQGVLGFEGTTTMGSSAGTVTIGAAGTLGLFNNTAANTKAIALQGGQIVVSGGTANTLGGPITITADSTIEVAASVNLGVTSVIDGPSGFTKLGTGILELSGGDANTYTGTTIVAGGTLRLNKSNGAATSGSVVVNTGTLAVAAANQFGSASSVTINTGGTWSNTGNLLQTLANFTVNTATLQTLNNLNVTNLLSVTAGSHDLNSGQSLTANALSISNGANFRLGANGASSTVNIGAGGLTLSDGTLQLGQPGGAVTALVNLSGNVTSSGTSAISTPNSTGPRLLDFQGATRTFNVTGGTTTVAAAIQNGGLTKSGAGTLVLTGSSFYPDATTITGGTLLVSGSISGSPVAVESGGTLSGDGFTGPVTVRGGGTLLSDANFAPLSVGSLAFEPASNFSIEINGTVADEVTVGGNVSLTGTIALSIAITSTAADGTIYTLVNSTSGISGYATGARFSYAGNVLDEGERFSVTSGVFTQDFTISYLADSGNDITIVAVPEPGSVALLLGATALVGIRRRRRS